MNAYERLMAEAIPTRPAPAPKVDRTTLPCWWTAEEQARHWAELGAAIADWRWDDDPRHLRLVDDEQTATDADRERRSA